MELSFEQADKLQRVRMLAYQLNDIMEELRPAGGFKDFVKKNQCKLCVAKTPDTAEDLQNDTQQTHDAIEHIKVLLEKWEIMADHWKRGMVENLIGMLQRHHA